MKQFLSLAAMALLSLTGITAIAQDTIRIVTTQATPPPPVKPQTQSHTQLNLYGNYVFDDHVESYYSDNSYFNGTVKGGFLWGVGLQFNLRDNYGLELLYMRQDTKANLDYYSDGAQKTDFDLSMNYVMLGGVKSIHRPGAKAEPYGGLMLGANFITVKNPENNKSDNSTKFAWGLRGGVNVWASDKVGIKLQAQLISSVQGAGGGLYFGTGGVGAGVSTYSSVLQFGLGGGLTFKIGK